MGPHLPSFSPLLLGHRLTVGEAECQIMGWEGRPLSGMGMVWGCPALQGPHQTANHKASLRQADNSALSIQAQPGWHSLHLCFSLAPLSESPGVIDSGNNERGAGLSPRTDRQLGPSTPRPWLPMKVNAVDAPGLQSCTTECHGRTLQGCRAARQRVIESTPQKGRVTATWIVRELPIVLITEPQKASVPESSIIKSLESPPRGTRDFRDDQPISCPNPAL